MLEIYSEVTAECLAHRVVHFCNGRTVRAVLWYGMVWYGMVQQHSLQKKIQSARYFLFHHRLHHFSSSVYFVVG